MVVEPHNFEIVDFNKLLKSSIQINIVDNLFDLSLDENKKLGNDIRNIMFHHIIHGLCEHILKKQSKVVVICCETEFECSDLYTLYSKESVDKAIVSAIRKISSSLPICVYRTQRNFNTIVKILESNDGMSGTLINSFKCAIEKKNISSYNFSKIKKIAQTYNLTFLNKEYFNNLSTKLLLVR
jgi:hypothetical protein